jgi:transposase-like protein
MRYQDLVEATETIAEAISWTRAKGIILSSLGCQKCHADMKIDQFEEPPDFEAFRCPQCHTRRSIRTDSIFYNSNLSMQKLLLLIYQWSRDIAIKESSRELEISSKTVQIWHSNMRTLISESTFMENERTTKIGGPGYVVEIDESVLSKRKYKRGRLVKEQWVFGGIVRGQSNEKPFVLELVENRTALTLLEVIQRRIAPGTTIISDGWKAYENISLHNQYKHYVINHSKNFVEPTNKDVHTQNIENLWKHLKAWIKTKGTNLGGNLEKYLFEYIFKKKHGDVFDGIMQLVLHQ